MSDIVDQAAEVLMSLGCQNDTDRLEALVDADLLRPEWATPEAERLLAAAVKRRNGMVAAPPIGDGVTNVSGDDVDSPEFEQWCRAQVELTAEYHDAVDAYVASLGGG